jgi:hypothetical protein
MLTILLKTISSLGTLKCFLKNAYLQHALEMIPHNLKVHNLCRTIFKVVVIVFKLQPSSLSSHILIFEDFWPKFALKFLYYTLNSPIITCLGSQLELKK